MKWILSTIIIFILNAIQPATATSCFNVGPDPDKYVLFMVGCKSDVCQQALEVEFNIASSYYPSDPFTTKESIKSEQLHIEPIVPHSVKYPANINVYLPLLQSKVKSLNGMYKMIVEKPDINVKKTQTSMTIIDIEQISNQHDVINLSDLADKYKDALHAYTSYIESGRMLFDTATTLISITVILYFLLFAFYRTNSIDNKSYAPDTVNLIFTPVNVAKFGALILVYFLFAFSTPLFLMYMQDSYIHFINYYKTIIAIFLAIFIMTGLFIFYLQYQLAKAQLKQVGNINTVYILQRTMLIVCVAALCNGFGTLYALHSLRSLQFLIIYIFALVYIPMALIVFINVCIYYRYVAKLNESAKLSYKKLQTKMTLLLVFPLVITFTSLIFGITRVVSREFDYHAKTLYALLGLTYDLLGLTWILVILPAFIWYVIRLTNLGFSKVDITFKVSWMIICIVILMVLPEKHQGCSNYYPNSRNLNQYISYAIEYGVRP